jgi:hypothetical protein
MHLPIPWGVECMCEKMTIEPLANVQSKQKISVSSITLHIHFTYELLRRTIATPWGVTHTPMSATYTLTNLPLHAIKWGWLIFGFRRVY